jgi:hypothetical protein
MIDCCQGVVMKTFCIAGPVIKEDHYFVAHRLNEPELMLLIAQKKYFILHAPRQTGKTTAVQAFVHQLNKQGVYKALYVNVEAAQAMKNEVIEGLRIILKQLQKKISEFFGPQDPGFIYLDKKLSSTPGITGNELNDFLTFWAQQSDKPLIIFMDEIDALVGDTLISVLRQIRAGHSDRPHNFPHMQKLLEAFAQFFRENADTWLEKFDYKEAGPHLLLMAFLQRIINGGGSLHREYALGRGRVDLLILWKTQRIVIELKLLYGAKTVPDGLRQTAEYMDINNATEGHLVIFDRRTDKSWDEKMYHTTEQVGAVTIDVWGM